MSKVFSIISFAGAALLSAGVSFAGVFDEGGDRLATLQNNDGGWDYPLTNGNPATGTAPNTIGPIGKGLAEAHAQTGSASQGASLSDAGGYLLAKTNTFSPSDGYLAVALDQAFGGTTYSNYVKANFYDKLAAGTYQRSGNATMHTTASYTTLIRNARPNNLSTWDLGMGLYAAQAIGASTSDWVSATKAELNESAAGQDYDVLGLAGGILGLAAAGESFDPTTGSFASDSSLADLGSRLSSYQLSTGGFTYVTGANTANSDETVQETAYAILALNELNRAGYLTDMNEASAYLLSMQLGTGGWENYPGGGEDNEITGEALWAVSAVPEPTGIALLAMGAAALLLRRHRQA